MPVWADQVSLVLIAIGCLVYAVHLLRKGSKGIRPFLLLTAISASSLGCAPSRPKDPSFVVVVHNQDTYPETAVVSWWHESTITGITTKTIAPGGSETFYIGFVPDGFELDTTAHPAQLGGQVWMTPEYRGFYVFHVAYPSGSAWGEFEVK